MLYVLLNHCEWLGSGADEVCLLLGCLSEVVILLFASPPRYFLSSSSLRNPAAATSTSYCKLCIKAASGRQIFAAQDPSITTQY